MPHYYFHLRHGSQLTIDTEGEDFPDDDAARAEAAETVHEMLAEAIRSKRADVPEAMVVEDEDGREVASVPFADAVPAGLMSASPPRAAEKRTCREVRVGPQSGPQEQS
jgi:hypothetical protein